MSSFFENKTPIDAQTLKQILDEIVSPRLVNRGAYWNGQTLWFNKSSNSIRQVFQYSKLKGEAGTFTWGVCIDFIPTFSSNRLIFHRTDKSVKPLLFEWTDEYANSFFGGHIKEGITNHWGVKEAKLSISKLLDRYEEKINKWFDYATSIENVLEITTRQIESGKSYTLHNPDPKLILAFLQAKMHEHKMAIKTISDLHVDENISKLLINQINEII